MGAGFMVNIIKKNTENRIAYFFKSTVIKIKNQNSPLISLDIHKAANKDI